MSLEYLPAI